MTGDTIRIPAPGAEAVVMRVSPLPRRGDFRPDAWQAHALTRVPGLAGAWWEVDLSALGLADGAYEYDFRIERAGQTVVAADPYAEEITRFGGYRGVFRIRNGHRHRLPFDWHGELPAGGRLPDNNELVLYELPMRWVDSSGDAADRQVGLGTFDKAIFERIAYLRRLGVNAVELLPVQDSSDTLNWGYGTRFFFAPDVDMGEPVDLKLFIKECHRSGIRVILDVVMNHSKRCPLEDLAHDMFYLNSGWDEPGADGQPRHDWGGTLFRYRAPTDGAYHARDFHYGMAEFWIEEYHVDGFRIDEFKGIDSWDFIREFRARAWQVQATTFPGRPFIVIAEDSWRRPSITRDRGAGKVVDAMWDFDFRDELRRLVGNRIVTRLGEPPRSARVRALISGQPKFDDMAARVAYNTSHDVEGREEQRLLPHFLEQANTGTEAAVDLPALTDALGAFRTALEQVQATFALMLTAVGIPMFLAGEEFADLHDVPHHDWRQKMSDPVDWQRADAPGHRDVLSRVTELVSLRRSHPALRRNEVEFFGMAGGFHPAFDETHGCRVFAYCRAGGRAVGSSGQVVVVANCGLDDYPSFLLDWPWGGRPIVERGGIGQPLPVLGGDRVDLALRPFQVRVFVL